MLIQKSAVSLVAKRTAAHAINEGGLGFESQARQIGTVSSTACHLCNVSSELYAMCIV